MTNRIHTNGNYTTVGMLQVLNEPVRGGVNATDMRKNFYPKAYERIQAAEAKLNVAKADRLHIQFMVSPSPLVLLNVGPFQLTEIAGHELGIWRSKRVPAQH